MATIAIWPGSASFASESNPTPFGFYNADNDFTSSADQVATWCAQRLGYPIVDIELQAVNFFTAFEEAVTTYAQYVYQYEIIENMATLEGSPTGSNLNNELIQPNLGNIITIGEQYGSEAGTGGSIDYKSGSIAITASKQVYSLDEVFTNVSESGNNIEVKRIYHYAPAAIVRYFDPYAGTGTGIQSLMETFGFGNFSPGVNFMLMPTYYDALKVQAIDITYGLVNQPGRQWIFRYTLALSKEMLASVRGKYSTVPIPGSEVTTNAAELRSEAAAEKTALIEELKLMLEESSRAKYMERESSIAQNTQDIMYKVPYPIYIY